MGAGPTMRILPCFLLLGLGACSFAGDSSPDVAAFGAGALAGGLTANPIIGVGVGLAARFAANEGVKYLQRELQQEVQDEIARAAGHIAPGEIVSWSVVRDIGRDSSGRVEVVREFGSNMVCRELIFSVREDEEERFFVGTICRGEDRWKWAIAEPSIERWGALQ